MRLCCPCLPECPQNDDGSDQDVELLVVASEESDIRNAQHVVVNIEENEEKKENIDDET